MSRQIVKTREWSYQSAEVIIVDLDGTLADSSERLQKVGFDPKVPIKDWPKEWGDASTDKPIKPIINLVQALYDRYKIWIVTIRPARQETIDWLDTNKVLYDKLIFLAGETKVDSTPAKIKEDWLVNQGDVDILFAIEDSPSMIEMFKKNDVRVLDVGRFYGSM